MQTCYIKYFGNNIEEFIGFGCIIWKKHPEIMPRTVEKKRIGRLSCVKGRSDEDGNDLVSAKDEGILSLLRDEVQSLCLGELSGPAAKV